MEKFFIKLYKLLNFSTDSEIYSDEKTVITTGSIITGVLFRTAIIIVLSLSLNDYFDLRSNWWFVALILWFLVAFPAYNKYKEFNNATDDLLENTLCGKCRYFDPTSQLCTIYDEHITKDYIPCGGDSWEPK
jgi:putative effector of murein hydrolase